VKDVPKTPANLPAGFEWSTVDLNDDKQAHEVYELLRENYVEDSEHTFRFDYPVEFLRWALVIPDYNPDWFVGVRASKTQKLLAFISAIPVKTRVRSNTVKMAEVNYLCVHKKLRTKRLAPVLIKEVTRRVNLTNVWQAMYTAGVVIPRPIATTTYYHRSLNAKKLVEVGFNSLPSGMPMARYQKMQKLPNESDVNIIGNIRPMIQKDIP
jgi:glycylpeptide N-tetradecanoyltransferase